MKGILFKPEMVKANNEGRKTVTRRLAGLKEINLNPDKWLKPPVYDFGYHAWSFFTPDSKVVWIKPRYHVGEVVYVKEAWAVDALWDDRKPSEIDPHASVWYPTNADLMNMPLWVGKLRTPMFLREIHARTFLEIVDVRPERLQEITDEDAIKEGVILKASIVTGNLVTEPTYRDSYAMLWDSINKPPYDWSGNPWVWRIEFKRVTREVANERD